MPYTLWSQDIFSKGELSPLMYGRVTVNEYNNGLKTAQNVLTYPTGAAGKRFGTLFKTFLTNVTAFDQFYFQTFQYLDECVYQLVITPGQIYIYLEGILVHNLANSLTALQIFNAVDTVIGPIFRFSGAGFAPLDLTRQNDTPVAITGFSGNQLILASAAEGPGKVVPAIFTTSGTLPVTDPPLYVGVSYFIYANSATNFTVYSNSQDAAAQTNAFTVISAGSGANLVTQNAFSFGPTVFKNVPFYDFNSALVSYDALTFTPSATTGSVTITVSGGGYSKLDASYIGGAFIGGGGSGRITAVASVTSFTVSVQNPFDGTGPILGSLALLAEPAWSTARGWPQVCSSYQNRALFANTVSLPNGFWASVINDYSDFGDLTTDDDDAISWYPTSNNMNYIKFIVPYRSITVHTNTGIYSSPLSDISAITPTNFTLQLQDSTPADTLQPQAIDNQILVLSGDDAHQMLWDGINNAYTSNIVSVVNEQVIRDPEDETAVAMLHRAGSRFVFIINGNGSMAVFQTLLAQGVSGFTPQIMEQSYGTAQFLQSASSSDGRCWFAVQRQLATQGSPVLITGYTAIAPNVISTLQATGVNLSTTEPTAIMFTTTGTLPVSTPQITLVQYYWAVGTDANNFAVYLDQADALDGVNEVQFTSAGTASDVVPWPLSTVFTMEEMNNDIFIDCAVAYNGSDTDVVMTGALFNAQDVVMWGDGYGFTSPGEMNINNEVEFLAHGSAVGVNQAYIGFAINTIMEPMPLNISSGSSPKQTTLTKPKHIRFVRFMFNNTVGGTINGVPIAIEPFDMADIGEPPIPANGFVELGVMSGWDDFNYPTYTIEHSDPFDIQLLGVYYSVEI
jgi:hypothetical protein